VIPFDRFIRIADWLRQVAAGSIEADQTIHGVLGFLGRAGAALHQR